MQAVRRNLSLIWLILGMAIVAYTATALIIALLYRTAYTETLKKMEHSASTLAGIMQAVAQFDQRFSAGDHPQGARGATLSQIEQGLRKHSHVYQSEALILGQAEGDTIRIMRRMENGQGIENTTLIPVDGARAQPLVRALAGQTGSGELLDYRGVTVLAGYAPVPALGMGVVYKIDLAEFRAPYIQAASWASVITLLAIGLAALSFARFVLPLHRRIENSEQRMRALVSAAPVGVYETDLQGHCTFVNEQWCALTGLIPEAAYGEGWVRAMHPDSRAEVYTAWNDFVAGRAPFQLEYSLCRPDGAVVQVYGQAIELKDASGRTIGYTGTITDLTHQKQTEAATLATQSQLEATLAAIPDLMFELGLDGTYYDIRAQQADLLAAPAADLLGSTIFDKLPPAAAAVVMAALQEAHATGQSHGRQFELPLPQGKSWFELSISRKPAEPDQMPRFIVLSRDITPRRQAELALHANEKRLKEAQSIAQTGSWELDVPTGALNWSDEIFQLFEIDKHMFGATYEAFLHAIHPDDRDAVNLAYNTSLQTREPYEIVHRLLMADGRIKWVHERCITEFDREGKALRSAGTVQDITRQKETENLLRESETRYHSVVSALSEGIVLNARDGAIIASNESAGRILGLSADQLHGRTPMDPRWRAIHEDGSPFPGETHPGSVSLRTGKPQSNVVMGVHKPDGALTWVSINSQPIFQPGEAEPSSVAASFFDITEQKQAQEMMAFLARASSASDPGAFFRLSVRKLAKFYGARYAFIGLLLDSGQDVQAVAVWAGEDFAPNFEYNLDGTPCRDVLDLRQELIPHDAARLYPEDAMLVEMGIDSYYGTPLISSNGRVMGLISVMDTKAMALTPWTAPLLGVFASRIAMEIERNAATESLRELNTSLEQRVAERTAELERASAAKNEFLSRMSHELRTPLNAIIGFSQLLDADARHRLAPEQAGNVREILYAGRHLLDLINEVLDLARIESGQLSLRPQAVATVQLIEECISLVQPLAAQRQIQIRFDAQEDCAIHADRLRLRQILLNLLSNAIKYNREAGKVDILCHQAGADRLRIAVQDTGRGIAAGAMPLLFKPFERMESAYDAIEGSGIGLALSKMLAEAMGGAIGVESIAGAGSAFWVEFPLAAEGVAKMPALTPAPPARPESATPRTLLYIEDNLANLRLVQKIIAMRAGLSLLAAPNAEAGLDLAKTRCPDLILLDINLPGMNGFEALQALRADPTTRGIPVIAVTANAMERDVKKGLEAGFTDYLTKPLDIARFLTLVDKALRKD